MPEENVSTSTTPGTPAGSVTPPVKEVIVPGGKTHAPKGDLGPQQDLGRKRIPGILAAFLPNRAVSGNTFRLIVAIQVAVFLLIWLNSPFKVLPTPMEVLDKR